MSISTELSRIQTDRNTIRNKLIELGLATSTDKLDALALAIDGLVNRGAVSVEILEGQTYTIPEGYHNGSGTVKAMTDTTGDAEKYKTQTKTATPTKKQQSISPDTGYYALSSVTVAPIPDAYQDVSAVNTAEGDVLTGKIYVKADGTVTTGTMPNNGAVSKTLDVTTITYTIPKGYHSGTGKVTITLEEKSVTPTKSTQTVTPTSGKVLSKVTVKPIPANYGDVSNTDLASVVEGSLLHDVSVVAKDENGNAVEIQGTMANNGSTSAMIDGLTNTSVTIPEGYTTGGTVALSNDIEDALSAI